MIAGGLSFISRSEDSIPSDAFDVCRMEAVPGRSNDLLSGEKRCNIAAREAPSVVPCVVSTHLPSPDGSEVYLCMPKSFSAYERCSLCEAGRSPKSNAFLTDIMDTNPKLTDMTGKKPRTPSYKYSFRLNEEQNIRFNELLCKAGSEHNRSRFIVKRIFAEEFVVIKRDPSKTQFIARLNEFYFQFQKLANNCAPVKAI